MEGRCACSFSHCWSKRLHQTSLREGLPELPSGGAIFRDGGGEMAGPRQGSRSGSGPLALASNEEAVRDEQGWSHLLLFF